MLARTVLSKSETQDLCPFTSIARTGFLKLANKLIQIGNQHGNIRAESILPHPTTISNRLKFVVAEKSAEMKSQLQEISKQGVAVTTDIWTDDYKKTSFLGVNVHFIDSGSLKERTVTVAEIEDKTAVNIHKMLEETLIEYGIEMKNAVFVTDRGCKSNYFFLFPQCLYWVFPS